MHYLYDVALSFATEEMILVENVYHYLKAEGLSVFFAPAPECQSILGGENQREVFYRIFGLESRYVALFVSKHYIIRDVPMEEANIAFSKHSDDGKVIPVYLDGTSLPPAMLDPKKTNYLSSGNPAAIASHIARKIESATDQPKVKHIPSNQSNVMNIGCNTAHKQVFVQTLNGNVKL